MHVYECSPSVDTRWMHSLCLTHLALVVSAPGPREYLVAAHAQPGEQERHALLASSSKTIKHIVGQHKPTQHDTAQGQYVLSSTRSEAPPIPCVLQARHAWHPPPLAMQLPPPPERAPLKVREEKKQQLSPTSGAPSDARMPSPPPPSPPLPVHSTFPHLSLRLQCSAFPSMSNTR